MQCNHKITLAKIETLFDVTYLDKLNKVYLATSNDKLINH